MRTRRTQYLGWFFGFPSSHCAAAVAVPCFASPICIRAQCRVQHCWQSGLGVWAATAAWGALIAYARLFLAVHSVPDVVGGLVLGLGFGSVFIMQQEAVLAIAGGTGGVMAPLVAVLLALAHPPAASLASRVHVDETLTESVTVLGCGCGAAVSLWRQNQWPSAALQPLGTWIHREHASGVTGMSFRFGLALIATLLSKVGFKVLVRAAVGCGAPPPPGDPAHASTREVLSRILSYTLMGWVLLDMVPTMCGAGSPAVDL